jgi:FG-GAP-like repeat
MGHLQARHSIRGVWVVSCLAVVVLGTTTAAAYLYWKRPLVNTAAEARPLSPHSYLARSKIDYFCSQCHAYPQPEILPRAAWKAEIEQAFQFFKESNRNTQAPAIGDVIRHYEEGAPVELPLPVLARAASPLPVSFQRIQCPALAEAPAPAISNVNLVHLFDERRLDVLACDMHAGLVMTLSPYAGKGPSGAPGRLPGGWKVLGRVPNPAHAEVVDLDGDGVKDILIANLGSPEPTNRREGSVVWLRGNRDGSFTPVTLLDRVGRVADVQAADFRGTGKLDLVVAVFGWRTTGEVLYLENQTIDWSHPVFVPHVLDERHGAVHVPVGDLNGDGRPDFVALISQEHETIEAFLNEGNGRFRKETIYKGPHPAYGSTGIQLVDLNGDGKLDVLYTNGDSFDRPHVLRPYHGIQWLENRGQFPFVHHPIATMYGAHRAVAADFRGTGKLDIVAVSYLPAEHFSGRKDLDAVIYLEQIGPEQFARHTLETGTCDHVTCAAGDVLGSGKIDLVTGNLVSSPGAEAVTIWRNQGPVLQHASAPVIGH